MFFGCLREHHVNKRALILALNMGNGFVSGTVFWENTNHMLLKNYSFFFCTVLQLISTQLIFIDSAHRICLGGIWGELELHKVMKGGRSYCTEEKSNERAVCTDQLTYVPLINNILMKVRTCTRGAQFKTKVFQKNMASF